MPWSSASHCGFRPMRAAGFPRTIAIWHSDNATLSWRRNTLHESSFMMPRQGLVEKVLQDRVEEMVASFWNVVAFRRRFTCIPIVPASGGCARMLCLLQQRSMLLGTEHAPMTHPPQVLLQGAADYMVSCVERLGSWESHRPRSSLHTRSQRMCCAISANVSTQCLVAPTIIVATVDTMRPRARRNTAEPVHTSPWRRRTLLNVILNRAFDSNRALIFEQIYGYHG